MQAASLAIPNWSGLRTSDPFVLANPEVDLPGLSHEPFKRQNGLLWDKSDVGWHAFASIAVMPNCLYE